MFLLLYGNFVDHMLQGLYLCISKEIGISVCKLLHHDSCAVVPCI